MRGLLVVSLILGSCRAGEPDKSRAPVGSGDEYIGAPELLAMRTAVRASEPWDGPWTVKVYAKDRDASGPASLSSALSAPLETLPADLPEVGRGELALVWLSDGDALELDLEARSPRPKTRGSRIAILGPGQPEWLERMNRQLPWLSTGIVDTAASTALWADPSLAATRPDLAGLVAARVIADHHHLEWGAAVACDAPPGLAQWLGCQASDPRSSDPRVRATMLAPWATLAAATDPDVAVRLAAARANEMPAVQELLSQDVDPLVRARAAVGLERVDRLLELTDDPSSVVRVVAAHRLASLAQSGEDTEGLAAALRALATGSPDAYVRWKAAWGLGALTGQVDVLSELARDVDVDVRREAASALGRQGDPAALGPLLALVREPNNFGRAVAARGLGELGDPAAVPALRTATDAPAALVSEAAARSLTQLGEAASGRSFHPPTPPTSTEQLRALLSSEDGTVLKDACKFAAGTPEAADLLGPLLGHTDGEVRKAAAQALGWSSGATPLLEPMLQDPDLDVLVTTLESLRRLGGFDGGQLDAALAHPDAEIRLRAAEALATLGPGDRLRSLASDPDERIRAAVARVLPDTVREDEPSVLVRRAGAGASPRDSRWASDPSALVSFLAEPAADPHGRFWARGVIAREDELVYLRFSFNDERDRPTTSRALLPPVVREYGHPDRG